jgi:hypothetical protein
MAQGASLRQYISAGNDVPSLVLRLLKKKKKAASVRRVLPNRQDIAYSFCFNGAETEIHKIKDDSKNTRQANLNRRGLRPIPIICLLDPPSLSLPTTFKIGQ